MLGSLLAILSANSFALNAIFLRRAVLKVSDASIGMLISVPMAVPLFFLILAFTGRIPSILGFSWQSYLWLSLAGILHFVIGRALGYKCVQLIGANIAVILRRVSILVAVFIGISWLNEPLSWQLAIGVLFIITGITLAALNPQTLKNSSGRFKRIPAKAFVLGFGCGVAFGLSPICVKLGLKDSGSPVAAALISYMAATVVLSFSLVKHQKRSSIAHITSPAAVLFFIAGLLSFVAQLFRYMALSLAPASVVIPIISSAPVFLLFFSFLLNRKLEIFSIPVIIGAVMVVVGTILLV